MADKDKNYTVGKGKPPKEHTWKPGQSGNPKGRPKKPKTPKDALLQALAEEISVNKNGKEVKMTILEALGMKLAHSALNGNKQAISLIMKEYSRDIRLPETEDEKEESSWHNLSDAERGGLSEREYKEYQQARRMYINEVLRGLTAENIKKQTEKDNSERYKQLFEKYQEPPE